MNSNSISGIFTIRSNQDGDWYEVAFKPDYEQIWSAQPTGFVAKFTEIDALYHVERIIGVGNNHELVTARSEGSARFLGQVRNIWLGNQDKFSLTSTKSPVAATPRAQPKASGGSTGERKSSSTSAF